MKAARAQAPRAALALATMEVPRPGPGEVLVKVKACGVCRTDLHIVDGELAQCRYPVTPGHEIVGTVENGGRFAAGARIGIPWLAWTCGACEFCASGRENLCERARFTGCHVDGGYAEYVVADERFCLRLPDGYGDAEAAPLLCAGLIGYRCYSFAGDARTIGLYGFGAAAHILTQVARADGRRVYAFTRAGDTTGQRFALDCGAHWAGSASEAPPEPLEAAILFAPAGELVPLALQATKKGGRVICGGIHMSDIPSFPYAWLWGERQVVSVANLTRDDGERFMAVAARVPIKAAVHAYPLDRANDALADLRAGRLSGAAVLVPG
ncbi:MAG TPA: zinc-dependent alcohol dehydrogenase family protein [Burkholderiales bacterium]|nr:zinc-dependent alcohol dehydrogenase family protein [Burkholderiales bacterium]